MPLATISDVEIDYGSIPPADWGRVDTLLERAEARIRQVFADLDDRIADGRTNEVLVAQVESEMVAAVLDKTSRFQSQTFSQAAGPFSSSISGTLPAGVATGGLLELTERHRRMLGEAPFRGPYMMSLSGGL